MLFMIYFEVTPEHRNEFLKRLRDQGTGSPASVKIVGGPWYSVTQLEGWALIEADSAADIGLLMHAWTDLNVNHVTPVITDEEVLDLMS